jgi:hypothetical protein
LYHNSFRKALTEGHTTYTFTLKKEDIDLFKEQCIRGIYVGLVGNGTGMWRMSERCYVCITKYKEDYTPMLIETDSTSWINENAPCFIGANSEVSEGSFSAYYFFNRKLYYALHDKSVENITVRILFGETTQPINGIFQLCYHDYVDTRDIKFNFVDKKNILGMFKLTDFTSDHYDFILSRDQINRLKNAKGLCLYAKDNDSFAIGFNKIITFIDYEEIEDEHYYTREFNDITFKSFVKETSKIYDEQFICGENMQDHLYTPFAFIGDNFKHFINNERVASVELTISTANKKLIDGRYTTDNNISVDFYCHNVTDNKDNYEAYRYTDYLFSIDFKNSQTHTIRLTDRQFEILKNNVGLGAVIRNNVSNEIISIRDIKIKVTYIR